MISGRSALIGVALGISLAIIPCLFGSSFWARAGGTPRLCLNTYPAGQRLAAFDLPDTGEFALSFIHSVSRTPVRDTYRMTGGTMLQTSEIFIAHGAGLPSQADELNATGWRHENGHFILDLRRPIGAMIIRVQPQYKNTLHIDDAAYPLADWHQPAIRFAPCEEEKGS